MKIEVDIEMACELIAESGLAGLRYKIPKVSPVFSTLNEDVLLGFEITEGSDQ